MISPHLELVDRLEQREQLKRVRAKLDRIVLAFCSSLLWPDFHAQDLLRWCRGYLPDVAPDSPRRVLAQLRREGRINYEVVNRRASLYRLLPVVAEAKPKRSLVNELRAELAAANARLEAAHARLRGVGVAP